MFSIFEAPSVFFTTLGYVIRVLLWISVSGIITCLSTWLTTSIYFWLSISRFKARWKHSRAHAHANPIPPPVLPYAIPWLGSISSLLSENPGTFWRTVSKKLAKTRTNVQVCTVVLGGKKAHVLNSSVVVQALFKSRHVSREGFNHRIAKALGASKEDTKRMWPSSPGNSSNGKTKSKKDNIDALHHELLLSSGAAGVLTEKFMECFQVELNKADIGNEWETIDLFAWMRTAVFNASTSAVMGTAILDMNPSLANDFWQYDSGFLARFYGIPKFLDPIAWKVRDDLLDKTERWVERVLEVSDGHIPEEQVWEPLLGSRIMRARHRFYHQRGMSARGRAAFDLGFLFGLSANIMPTISWLLAHLLSPTTSANLLSRIQVEVEQSLKSDGRLDVSILMTRPLLNAVVQETMRHYVDCFVTRELTMDINLDGYFLEKGDLIIAPTFMSHHDESFWRGDHGPSPDEWYAERFLKQDSESSKDAFGTSWTSGMFFPFGGGAQACPGRVFAKQMIFTAVTLLFAHVEIQFVEYLGTDSNGNTVSFGQAETAFPKVKKQYAGNGTLSMDGDIRVRMRSR